MAHGEAGGSEDADARCSNVGRQFYATTVNCAGLIWLMDGVEHGLVDGHSVAVCSHRRSRPQLRQDKISAPNIRVFHFFRSVPDVGGHCAIRIGNRHANPSSNLPRLFTIAVDQLFEARFTNISTSISDQDRALVVVAQLQPLRALSSVRRASFIHAAPREEREREKFPRRCDLVDDNCRRWPHQQNLVLAFHEFQPLQPDRVTAIGRNRPLLR